MTQTTNLVPTMRKDCLKLAIVLLLCGACQHTPGPDKERTLLAEVAGKYLYYEDLQAMLPTGLTKEDSANFAQQYIRNWAEEMLLYEKAQSNIPDNNEIERRVENYRKALIMHTYQQALISQRLADEITEAEMKAYYDENHALFRLEEPLIKGLFIKIPLTAPRLSNVRQWYKDESRNAVEHLEKYQMQHAVKYEYFYDKWVPVADVMGMLPLQEADPEAYLDKHRHVELKDTAFYYFLNISDYRPAGEQEPYETARTQVKEILRNMQQVEFMRNVKNDLYERAVKENKIKYY